MSFAASGRESLATSVSQTRASIPHADRIAKTRRRNADRGVPHAFLVRSATARLLVLITPGSGAMDAFLREAGEPAPERTLPPERPLDMERIAAAAEHTGAVTILGPPPFDEPAGR
jgi:hypothetical protein